MDAFLLLSLDKEWERAFSVQCLLSSKCHIWNWFEESLESLPRRFMSYSTSWTLLKWLLLLLLNANIFIFESKMWKEKVKNLNSFLMRLSKPFVPAGDLKTNSSTKDPCPVFHPLSQDRPRAPSLSCQECWIRQPRILGHYCFIICRFC